MPLSQSLGLPKQRKSKGQVFLRCTDVIHKIVEAASKNTAAILEIGPGKGALTAELLKSGLPVTAIEIDPAWSQYLESKFTNSGNLNIVNDDVLKLDLALLLNDLHNKAKHINIVSNLPYNITGPVLFKLAALSQKNVCLHKLVLMMQKEVGERIIAPVNSKHYGFLSIYMQYCFRIKRLIDVNRRCFRPVPKVDSIVLELDKNPHQDDWISKHEVDFFKFIKTMFLWRRKNIINCLSRIVSSRESAIIIIDNSKLVTNLRPQNLRIEDFKTLYIEWKKHVGNKVIR